MIVHQLEHSPFCIPVTRVLEACGIPFETAEVPNHDRSSVIRLTGGAYYQVPVLEDGDAIIFESGPDTQDVAGYLDSRYAGGRLFPPSADGWQSIVIPYLENEVESVTFKLCDIRYIDDIPELVARVMTVRHKERRFGRGCVEQWKAGRSALAHEAVAKLRPFESILAHSEFLLGCEPVYADFLLFGVLGNLTYRNYNPLPPLEHLRRWHSQMACWKFPS